MGVLRAYKAGVTPKRVARQLARKAHNPSYKPRKLDGWQMNALQRRSELDRLIRHRTRTGAELGPQSGWIEVIANYVRVRNGTVSAADVRQEAVSLGLPKLDPSLLADVIDHISRAAWGHYKLFSPKLAGDKLRLTSEERSAAEILKIEAFDEPKEARLRRLDAERKKRKRAADAAPHPDSDTKADLVAQLAADLGKSPATIYRWMKTGRLENENLDVRVSRLPKVITPGHENSHRRVSA